MAVDTLLVMPIFLSFLGLGISLFIWGLDQTGVFDNYSSLRRIIGVVYAAAGVILIGSAICILFIAGII